jgi:SAM-dependent methyltransferase
MYQLTDEQKAALIARYSGRFQVPLLSYGTVRDYCDSCDNLTQLSVLQHDLKDLQRPWTVKVALKLMKPGSRLLEIGAGPPLVAAMLADLGYDLTIVDPYDGSAGGPTEFQTFAQCYPKIRFVRNRFRLDLPQLEGELFDGIFSISVLEHVPEPELQAVFAAIATHLRPGGHSFHSVDCVTHGEGSEYHIEQCARIANHQAQIAGGPPVESARLAELFEAADEDIDTYYLSAEGHNLWRGGRPYDTFRFRRVISFQVAAVKVPPPETNQPA